MIQEHSSLLKRLIELSKVDASLARIKAEKDKCENELADQLLVLQDKDKELSSKTEVLATEQERYRKEEKRLKEENDKLVERRKALNTFSDYKVQQSAQKEIEQSAKQLTAQEEKLLQALDHSDMLEKEVEELKTWLENERETFQKFESDTRAKIDSLQTRLTEKETDRSKLIDSIDKKDIVQYERIRTRFIDPVVPLEAGVCTGCHVQVGAQLMLEVAKATMLVKCRGCGRFLYLEQNPTDNAETLA